jgi:hypothetical protein
LAVQEDNLSIIRLEDLTIIGVILHALKGKLGSPIHLSLKIKRKLFIEVKAWGKAF